MNEHQLRLIKRMWLFLSSYEDGTISFPQLVGELECAFYAGEFKDEIFSNKWYELWGPLEDFNAVEGNNVNKNEVHRFIKEFKDFLYPYLTTNEEE